MSIEERAYNRTSYVLVVDDDDTLLKFFKIHLNKFFSKVVVVKSAADAIAKIKELEIDLVLSDIKMPRMDGIQLMKKVKAHDPSIPVFLISGALLEEKQKRAIDEKADGYLTKPFSIDDLHGFIDRGMQLRDCYKELHETIGDDKLFVDIVSGKKQPTKLALNVDVLSRIEELIKDLEKIQSAQAA